MEQDLKAWILARLEEIAEQPRVLLRDPLHLLSNGDVDLHTFAREHGFTAVAAATNLVFRDLYERATADPEVKKLLVVDRSPASRRARSSVTRAPALFYPDFLATVPPDAQVNLNLRQFLQEATGDPNWPQDANLPQYARLIARHLKGVLRAHQNLRAAQPGRFTDHDFKTIVAFAALGVAESAFKHLGADDYWRIGLLGHQALKELEQLAPEITAPIRTELAKAPAPFCWFADRDPEAVVRGFYLSLILAQHLGHWNLLLANVDPSLAPFASVDPVALQESAPQVIALNPEQATRDLEDAEGSLGRDALQLLLLDQMKLDRPEGFSAAIGAERYSILFRSLALLLALDDLLSPRPAAAEHDRISAALDSSGKSGDGRFVEARPSSSWSHLKEAYGFARTVSALRAELAETRKSLKVLKTDQLSFAFFRERWNDRQLNRLEYDCSRLERLVQSADLLPRPEPDLPPTFGNALRRIRQQVEAMSGDVQRELDELNRRFQDLVAADYPEWVKGEKGKRQKGDSPILTAQFLERCLKPYWDPENEKAVILIFDGMRYDIWDELLKPMLADRLEVVADLPGLAILPSETQLTRKAISAGTFPDEFDDRAGEDRLLKEGLSRTFGYTGDVRAVAPEGAGTGETVRYRAGNLDVFIFELCDKELHAIRMRTLPDGRLVPSRPLAFVYQQHLKNIIDTEVMAILRSLEAGTKVFVTADHGFGRIGRQEIRVSAYDLNESEDCAYLNCWLKVPFEQAELSDQARSNVIAFTPGQLHLPRRETRSPGRGAAVQSKEYRAVLFPRVGHAFRRPDAPFNPDAYSHGGISIQELLIPMVVLRVRARDEGMVALDLIEGPAETVEGEDVEFRMTVRRSGSDGGGDLRLNVEASYRRDSDRMILPRQVLYLTDREGRVVCRFRPDPAGASDDERRRGLMERTLTIAVSYQAGRHVIRASRTRRFSVRLNLDRVIRRVGNLGSILGLAPRNMR